MPAPWAFKALCFGSLSQVQVLKVVVSDVWGSNLLLLREKHSFEFFPDVVHHARADEFFLVCLMCRSGSTSCFILFIPEEIDPYVAVEPCIHVRR